MPLPFARRGIDPDAADFCSRSGASDVSAIDAFVKGVKDLGLWNSMVCWPLRRSQNSGTNTAFSLGGLGTFNGTLTNGPTWGTDGLTNSANGDIRTSWFIPGGAQAHIAVSNSTTDSVTRAYGGNLSNVNTKGTRFRDDAALYGDGALQGGFRDFTSAGQFKMSAALYNRPSASFTFLNTTSASIVSGNAVVASENTFTMLAARDLGNSTQFYSGVMAFYVVFAAEITTPQYLSVYNLYRATLGTGLGLPDYDPATIEYAARSGATDLANIDAFVRGVKDLGLWNSMVCWPLRSTQNAGTGDTVYSLGGLGTFNGTRVNGPTWGTSGILFDAATNTHITTLLDVIGLRKFTAMVATEQRAQVGPADAMISAWGTPASSQYLILRKTATTFANGIVRSGAATKSLQIANQSPDWRVYGWGTQGADTVLTASGAQIGSQAFLPDETGSSLLSIGILQPPNGAPYDGTIAWAMFYKDNELTTAQQLSVYTLYRATLGTGLGLP
jgi:hypothetical protein